MVITCGRVLVDRDKIIIISRHIVDGAIQEETFIRPRTKMARKQFVPIVFSRYSLRTKRKKTR